VPRHPLMPRTPRGARAAVRIVAVLGLLATALGPLAIPAAAADGLTMEAHVLVGGHARVGSWAAISIHLKNDGPAVRGELRLAGGTQGGTRFGRPVDLPTQSDQAYVLYAQPPTFGSDFQVVLADGDRTVASAKATFQIHDANQLVVAIIAEHPERIIGTLGLLPDRNQLAPLVIGLSPEDLPERVEAWSTIDRIVWQDVDSERLTTPQRDSLRGWIAGGGRLVVVGGTAGPKVLSAFPDLLLPYRPAATTDVPPANLVSMLGGIPTSATILPALSGELSGGHALATVGDRVVAADQAYGSGSVTLVGFDPTVDWIAKTDAAQGLWRRLLPARTFGGLAFFNDDMLVSAVSQLPSLALPPVGGLLLLLAAYILLIGPINYLVLKRLDRREWAWFTMPLLIVVFAAGAYAFGAVLRGSDMVVNEVAIVRGAPGATDGAAQVYLGIFSPSRGLYQLRVPGGALLSTPINGDAFAGVGTGQALDVLQGDPARVRNLAVGFGSLRAIRAETAVAVPLIQTDLRLQDGRLKGSVKNASNVPLERPAVVLGGTVAVLPDLAPGAEASVDVPVVSNQFGASLSDRVVGPLFFSDPSTTPATARLYVRHNMVDQLTSDPNVGVTNLLSADGPVVLAWGSGELLPVEIENQVPQHLGNVLYYLPARLTVSGKTTFRSDLIRSTVVASDAVIINKEPTSFGFGRGTTTVAYRPIGLEGTIDATDLTIGLNSNEGGGVTIPPVQVKPVATTAPFCSDGPAPDRSSPGPSPDCTTVVRDGLPQIEVLDVVTQAWRRLPHVTAGTRYSVSEPAHYVDPSSGTVLVRYINDANDSVYFAPDVSITGTVR
jgi:hypothetical protein